jgi:hypothetical protein
MSAKITWARVNLDAMVHCYHDKFLVKSEVLHYFYSAKDDAVLIELMIRDKDEPLAR